MDQIHHRRCECAANVGVRVGDEPWLEQVGKPVGVVAGPLNGGSGVIHPVMIPRSWPVRGSAVPAAQQRELGRGSAQGRRILGMLHGPDQYEAVDWLWVEEGNLNEILRQAITDRDQDAVVVLAAALTSYWWIVGDHQRVVALSSAVLDVLAGYVPPVELAVHAHEVATTLLINTVIYYGYDAIGAYRRVLKQLDPIDEPRIAAFRKALLSLDDESAEAKVDLVSAMAYGPDREEAVHASQWLCPGRDRHQPADESS